MKNTKEKASIKALQIRMLVAYVLLVLFSIYMITSVVTTISNRILSNKVSSLVAANCQQIEVNINYYLNDIERITTLLFSDEKYYKFDPVANFYDDYSRIKAEEKIAERIIDLGVMQNFTDFTIVYSDGNRVGWTSNNTAALFKSEEMYSLLSNVITDSRTEDGWAFGLGGLTDRLFYVKRLNKNALILVSFYARELEEEFEYPEELEGMVLDLVDKNNVVLYSSQQENIANPLDDNIAGILAGQTSKDYIVNINYCDNGWSVVSIVPTSVIMRESNALKKNTLIISLLLSIVMVVIGLTLFSKMFKPMDSAVKELEEDAVIDKLSGLNNKQSFNAEVCRQLSQSKWDLPRAFVMIDMDNFKQINDNLGHAYGDEVITRMGRLLQNTFGSDYVVGRMGGDEFAVFTESENKSEEELKTTVVQYLNILFKAFDNEFAYEKEAINISLSIGLAVISKERRFDNLYNAADEALYKSKHAGKNRYTIYEKGEVEK